MSNNERIIVVKPTYDYDFIYIIVSHISAYKFYNEGLKTFTVIYLDSGETIEVEMTKEEFYKLIGDKDE